MLIAEAAKKELAQKEKKNAELKEQLEALRLAKEKEEAEVNQTTECPGSGSLRSGL